MKNSEKKFKYIDLRDAAGNLALSQHHLVMELLKLGSMICIRFDDISSRMVKIVPPKSHQKFIDYRINPGDIHCLTLDSSKRIERMLKKSELVFEGLRLEIDFGGYPLTLQIVEDDPGMHLVIMEDNLEMLKKLIINDSNISGFEKSKEIGEKNILSKIKSNVPIKKLKNFFCTLEEQEFVQRGSIKKIEEHFTERSLKLPVKERVKPIEWISAKYKAVHLLKKLRNLNIIEGSDKEFARHFSKNGKELSITNYTRKATDKLDQIEEIFDIHFK